jgi:hypothetical protein
MTACPPREGRTAAEVLRAAMTAMDADDLLQAYLRGEPCGVKRPRRFLRRWLSGPASFTSSRGPERSCAPLRLRGQGMTRL